MALDCKRCFLLLEYFLFQVRAQIGLKQPLCLLLHPFEIGDEHVLKMSPCTVKVMAHFLELLSPFLLFFFHELKRQKQLFHRLVNISLFCLRPWTASSMAAIVNVAFVSLSNKGVTAGRAGKQPAEREIVNPKTLRIFACKNFLNSLKERRGDYWLVATEKPLSGFLDLDFTDVKAAVKQQGHTVPANLVTVPASKPTAKHFLGQLIKRKCSCGVQLKGRANQRGLFRIYCLCPAFTAVNVAKRSGHRV